MIKLYFTLLVLGTSLILNAQTVIVTATQDNTIYSDLPGNSNGAGDNFTAGSINVNTSVRRALIRFDMSAIPSGATITSATLTLNMNKTVSGATGVSLHKLAAAWGEAASDAGSGADGQGAAAVTGDATWLCSFAIAGGGCATSWSPAGGNFSASASATTAVDAAGSYSWSSAQLAADIQDWINTPANNFGWIIIGDEIGARTAKRFDSRTSPIAANRPSLSITYSAVVPVSLISFKASAETYGTRLQWKTAQEINNDHFVIEHSTDGQQFSAIGKVAGAGNSSVEKSYQYIHQNNNAGTHYYRLVQIDINAQKHLSEIVVVKFNSEKSTILISPNPVQDKINLPGLSGNGNKYQVLNTTGQKLLEGNFFGSQINLNGIIKPGLYQLMIYAADGSVRTTRFLKQ